jgi:SAM-dependent methyltransferase
MRLRKCAAPRLQGAPRLAIIPPRMSVPFTPLSEAGLGIDRTRLLDAMEPFVAEHVGADDPRWLAEVARKTAKTRRQARKRRWLGWLADGRRRDQRRIEEEYDASWARKQLAPYVMEPRPTTGSAWQYGDDRMFATSAAGSRARLLVLMKAIALLRPRTVLEVGCGNGINLLTLACVFPATRFAGVELTAGGHAVAQSVRGEPQLPEVLRRFSPEPIHDPSAHGRITFHRGSADALPCPDAGFDLVYSSLALEQMEQIRGQALREMARASGRHTLMLEPFWECNDRGLRRDYLVSRDHFRGRVDELPSYGLDPMLVTADVPGEIWLQPCLVVCRKRPASVP